MCEKEGLSEVGNKDILIHRLQNNNKDENNNQSLSSSDLLEILISWERQLLIYEQKIPIKLLNQNLSRPRYKPTLQLKRLLQIWFKIATTIQTSKN